MEPIDELQRFWKDHKDSGIPAPVLNKEEMKKILAPKIRKEQRFFLEYFFAFYFWLFLLYSALFYFMIRYWGDWIFDLLCLIGIGVYIPYTIVFIKNFRNIRYKASASPDASLPDIYHQLRLECRSITHYFNFKKRLDLVGMPLLSLIIVALLSKFSALPAPGRSLLPAIIAFLLILGVLTFVTLLQNKKNFIQPLRQLQFIIKELEKDDIHLGGAVIADHHPVTPRH